MGAGPVVYGKLGGDGGVDGFEGARVKVELGVVEGASWLAVLGSRWSVGGVASVLVALAA